MSICVLHEIESPILRHWLDLNHIILVDVRESCEYKDGIIPGALFNPMSQFEPETLSPDPQKKTLFYCHGGRRSHAAALKWAEHWDLKEVYHLKGGILSWKKYDYPVIETL